MRATEMKQNALRAVTVSLQESYTALVDMGMIWRMVT